MLGDQNQVLTGLRTNSQFTMRSGARPALFLSSAILALWSGCAASRSRTALEVDRSAQLASHQSTLENAGYAEHSVAQVPISSADDVRPSIADPAADVLVQSMLSRLSNRQIVNGATRISLDDVRNQSRCGGREFEQMKERLASALSRAGRKDRVEFIVDSTTEGESAQDIQYAMQGAGYLVTRDGFDCWELWLSLSSVEYPLTLWQPESPVWLLRHPRPNQPQLLLR